MSWLKPYLRTWYQAYPESVPPVRQLAHYVKPLLKAHPEDRICGELAAYLQQTPPVYVSLHRFAALFGKWVKPKTPQAKPYQWRSVDECDRAAGIEVPE